MKTNLRDFSIMIPRHRMVEASRYLIKRIDNFVKSNSDLRFDGELYMSSDVLFNFALISGKAPVEVVTILAAFAQGHDVDAILNTFENKENNGSKQAVTK